jgi:predicted nucleotidyltransferase
MAGLYWNTVTDLLREVLSQTMESSLFDPFRLVGGTSLSLQIGHRISVDIDLFTDASYGSIDFDAIERFFRERYPYVSTNGGQVGIGTSYFVGENDNDAIKVDLYYTDPFIQSAFKEDGVRLASVEEIIAMKLDVVSRGGRKKDFWDIHALMSKYSQEKMLQLHEQRYPYSHDKDLIRRNMTDFDDADDDFDPICLRGEIWELIKYDIVQWTNVYTGGQEK